MIYKIKSILKRRNGFTLVELLMAVLILLMVSSVMAGGIPVAIQAYYKIVDSANAQVLLSTTMTKLRDELGTAVTIIGHTDKSITFTNASGNQSVIIFNSSGTEGPGIYITEIAGPVDDEGSNKVEHLLVSKEASSKRVRGDNTENLYVEYETLRPDGDIIIFKNLIVRKTSDNDARLATISEFKIRVLAYIS